MRTKTFLFSLLLLAFASSSCSNPQKEYEDVKNLQNSAELSISKTSDDAVKLKLCEEVTNSLDVFLKKHPDGEWAITAKSALSKWKTKKDSVQELINSKLDFDELQKLQTSSEQIMQISSDYMVRLKSCDDMLSSLQAYLVKHQESSWANAVNTSLLSWKSRKADLEHALGSLYSRLYTQLRERATAEAQKVHGMSRIEQIQLENRESKPEGSHILVTEVYAIRMRGTILGTSIFKLKVTVSGRIEPESGKVFVNDKASVEE